MGRSDAPAAAASPVVVESEAAPATDEDSPLAPAPEPVPASKPSAPPPPHRPPAFIRWRPRLIFVAALGVTVVALIVPAIEDVVDEVEGLDLPTVVQPESERPREREEAGPPRGLSRRSMLLRSNLAPAVPRLRAQIGGRLRHRRLEAERIRVEGGRHGPAISGQAR